MTPGKEMHECIGMACSLAVHKQKWFHCCTSATLAPIVLHKSVKLGLFQPVQPESQVHLIETTTSLASQQEPPSTKAAEIIKNQDVMQCGGFDRI